MAEALTEMDLFVFPSFAAGVPVALMEAMVSGLPVIATRIAGISELVEEGVSGHLVPPARRRLWPRRLRPSWQSQRGESPWVKQDSLRLKDTL